MAGEICTGYQTADNTELERKDGKFTMPAAAVAFQKHETTDNWMAMRKMPVDGFVPCLCRKLSESRRAGEPYLCTWPQYLTRVVLIAKDGTDEKELVKPQYARRYDNGDQRDKQLGAGRILYGLSESNKFLSL